MGRKLNLEKIIGTIFALLFVGCAAYLVGALSLSILGVYAMPMTKIYELLLAAFVLSLPYVKFGAY